MMQTIRLSVYWLCCLLLFMLYRSPDAHAQFTRMDDPAMAGMKVSPLARLFEGWNTLLGNVTDYNGPDQTWDSTVNHYRGNLLKYLHYPELAHAGVSQFSLVPVKQSYQLLDQYEGVVTTLIDKTELALLQDHHRSKLTFHFDTEGWLRTIVSTNLYPEWEGYSEKTDSLYYNFNGARITQVRWVEHEHTSGTNFSTSECGPLPRFVQFVSNSVMRVSLNAFDNITGIESTTNKQWDSCKAGSPWQSTRDFQYDAEGKLLRVTEHNSRYTTPVSECNIEYEVTSLDTFLNRVKGRLSFEPFREHNMNRYLSSQRHLSCIIRQQKSTNFLRYDPAQHRDVIRTDSPNVYKDTAYFLVNNARQRIATASPAAQLAMFYRRDTDPGTGNPFTNVQSLKMLPDVKPGSAVVCKPIVYNSNLDYEAGLQKINGGTLSFYSVGNTGKFTLGDDPQGANNPPRQSTGLRVNTMTWADEKGRLLYLWLPNITYKIIYP